MVFLLLMHFTWVHFTFERSQNTFFVFHLSVHFQFSLFSSYRDLSLLALINNRGRLASHIIQNKLEVTKNVLDLDTCFGNPLIFKAQKPGCKFEILTRGPRSEF